MLEDDERRPVEYGLADRVDEWIFRVQTSPLRRSATVSAVAVVALLVAAGWWWGSDDSTGIEATIPYAAGAEPDATSSAAPSSGATSPESPPATGSSASPATSLSTVPETVVVHVSGAVLEPGLVELATGSRVADAVAGAGGPTVDADVHRLNLAAVAIDGSQIVVPGVDEEIDEPLIRGSNPPGGAAETSVGEAVVDINTADRAELETLPGIGPATSAAIEAWRTDNGPFRSIEDLLEVPGIGPAKLAAIADRVVV